MLIIITLCYIVTKFDSEEDAIIISGILVVILLFLLIRELVCWYWKINYRIIKQDEICNLLVKQIKILEQINDNTKKQNKKRRPCKQGRLFLSIC